jgi:hypothetical protein
MRRSPHVIRRFVLSFSLEDRGLVLFADNGTHAIERNCNRGSPWGSSLNLPYLDVGETI